MRTCCLTLGAAFELQHTRPNSMYFTPLQFLWKPRHGVYCQLASMPQPRCDSADSSRALRRHAPQARGTAAAERGDAYGGGDVQTGAVALIL